MSDPWAGGGALQYRVSGPRGPGRACPCETGQRTSGHCLAATPGRRAGAPADAPVHGGAASDVAAPGFCGPCGSHRLGSGHGLATPETHVGTLGAAPGLAPSGRIFVAEKGAPFMRGLTRRKRRDRSDNRGQIL